MLSSICPREALLACLLSPPWNLPSSLRSSPFPPTLILFSLARLSLTLTLSYLTIWCFRQTVLFLFFLTKAALTYLPTALFTALRLLSPFRKAQYVQVFLLKLVLFCKLFSGLSSTSKSATSLLLLSDSRSVLGISYIFPFTSIFLAETIFSLLLYYQAIMDSCTLVSPREQHG